MQKINLHENDLIIYADITCNHWYYGNTHSQAVIIADTETEEFVDIARKIAYPLLQLHTVDSVDIILKTVCSDMVYKHYFHIG